jgi:membrane fusion protein, multidrug efflux system
MNDMVHRFAIESKSPSKSKNYKSLAVPFVLTAALLGGGAWVAYTRYSAPQVQAMEAPLPTVTAVAPLQADLDVRTGFIGQFSAVDQVEIRAQVGGTLKEIHFKDGEIVHKGDLLFTVDPRPYEIKLQQAKAQLETAKARFALAENQLNRAQALHKDQWASADTVDQRVSERDGAQAAIDDAKSRIRDSELDLEYSQVKAPFTGRMGARKVSLGSLVAGSRAATSPTTLLATIVSLDPIYLNFDMSEAAYMNLMRERQKHSNSIDNKVAVSLSDEGSFTRNAALDFVDNALDRSSGTIHARATLANNDLFLTPGGFARVQLAITPPSPVLLVPDAAVLPDQSQHIVLTVGADNIVTPKPVELGDIRNGLRVIRSGLLPTDKVIIDGIPTARPGSKVTANAGTIQFAQNGG